MAKHHKEAYDLSVTGHVTLSIQGRFIDENYSRVLISHSDFTWSGIFALDRIQKGTLLDESTLTALRNLGSRRYPRWALFQ